MTAVTFEEGTTQVVARLFEDADKLMNVPLLDTMTSIGDYAFESCTALVGIDIPDSVTSIGEFAFSGCTQLSNVQLSNNLDSIGRGTFSYCTSLLEIDIPKSLTQVLGYSTHEGTFSRSGLTTVTFEEGTAQVIDRLFEDADKLMNVPLLDTMTSIGDYAFENCAALAEIDIPDSVTSIGNSAFGGCVSLAAIIIPDSVTEIGSDAFWGCSSLSEVTLPDKLTIIYEKTFQNCLGLESIQLPGTLSEIGNNAFAGSGLVQITIPSSCEIVRNDAFNGCAALEKVEISNGVTSIGDSVFENCIALTEVTLPNSVISFGEYAFAHCDVLNTVVLPNSVTSFGEYAFAYCELLSNVTLGSGLTEIPQYAFYECPALQSVAIPYRVKTISEYAFANCTNLTEATIPQSVTEIAKTAFSYPQKMTIYGVAGSYAETFANENGFKFAARSNPATSVTLDRTELTISKGSTAQLVANILPADFTDTVSWKSTDTSVATVTDMGIVKGINTGTATIKVVAGSASATCSVTVTQPVTSISLNKTSLTLEAPSTFQLIATANPTNAQNREVTWSSSDPEIASVDATGLVTAHKKGSAIVTATAMDGSKVSRSCTVNVPNNAYVVASASELESSHPYTINCNDVWVYTVDDATYLELLFDEQTDIEDGFDYLYIYNGSGDEIGKYSGTDLAGKTVRVSGNTVKIKLVSDDSGTTWGFKVADLKTDGTINIYEGLLSEINRLGALTDVSEMVSGVQKIEQSELLEAMQDQENGTEVVAAISELEQATNIRTLVEISEDMATNFKEDEIQVLGAALNIAQVAAEEENVVKLVIDVPSEEHNLTEQYKNTFGFSMHLENASDNLHVPIQITLPVPSVVDTTGLALFHYKEDGTSENVPYTLSYVNEQAYVTFVLSDFSDFQFANLSYVLGDVNGDGRVNIMDVDRLFRYVSEEITLSEEQQAAADVNEDGRVNVMDVDRLFRYVNQQISE